MNKTDARALMMKYLMPQIEKYGFKERGKGIEFEVVRKTQSGSDIISGGFTDYNPVQQIIFGTGKINNLVIEILMKVENMGVQLSPPINKKSRTISVSYELTNNLNVIGYLPLMETEAEVEKCVGMMVDFMETTAFPLLDKFEDLREIDKIINGEEPWETDWGKPYRFGGNFDEKRLIIAKLAGNPDYERLIDFNYKTLERLSAENGHPFVYDRNDLSKPLPTLIRLLENVKPLY